MSIVKRFLAVLVFVFGLVPTSSVNANWETIGDTRLVVEPGICEMYKYQNKAFCGPELTVRVPPLLTKGDGVTVSVSLAGPSGHIALEYGNVATISNGISFTDRDYWQSKSQTSTPTDLPFGPYTFRWEYFRRGQWTCSKYNPNGCSWSSDQRETYTYAFDWQGVKLETYPLQGAVPVETSFLNDIKTRRSRSLSGPEIAQRMLTGGYFYANTDQIVLRRMSGRSCKVTAESVTATRRGKCRIELTATTTRNWKYIFQFNLTVK
jgi:hypothetical protein